MKMNKEIVASMLFALSAVVQMSAQATEFKAINLSKQSNYGILDQIKLMRQEVLYAWTLHTPKRLASVLISACETALNPKNVYMLGKVVRALNGLGNDLINSETGKDGYGRFVIDCAIYIEMFYRLYPHNERRSELEKIVEQLKVRLEGPESLLFAAIYK